MSDHASLLQFVKNQLNDKDRRSFVKDMSLPISVCSDPMIFMAQLKRTDELYGGLSKLRLLQKDIEKFGSMKEIINEFNKVLNAVVSDISSCESYKKLVNIDASQFKRVNGVTKMYHPDHDGKRFISIDLKKANFQALNWLDPSLVKNKNSYEELIADYTESVYIPAAKKMRQIIFGNLSPVHQQSIQQHLMNSVFEILEQEGMKKEDAVFASADELVICYSDQAVKQLEKTMKRLQDIDNLKELTFHITKFQLNSMPGYGHPAFYHKTDFSGKVISLNCVPSIHACEVICYLNNEKCTSADMAFEQDGRIASFLSALDFTKTITPKKDIQPSLG